MTYAYSADTYCDSCGHEIMRALGRGPERGEDSNTYPQYHAPGEADYVDHCARGAECLERIDLRQFGLVGTGYVYVGAIVCGALTDDGTADAQASMLDPEASSFQAALYRLWAETFPQLSTREAVLAQAREQGEDAARSAASWCVDGNTDEEHARRVVRMLDDGDPEADEYLPRRPDLSGEWAGEPTPQSLAKEIVGTDCPDEIVEAISEAWEEGVTETFEQECERLLRTAAGLDDLEEAHAQGMHDETPREHCPECERTRNRT